MFRKKPISEIYNDDKHGKYDWISQKKDEERVEKIADEYYRRNETYDMEIHESYVKNLVKEILKNS